MALPSTGSISMSQVLTELGLPAGTPISMNSPLVRRLFNIPSGPVSMSNGHSKLCRLAASMTAGNSGGTVGFQLASFGSMTSVGIQGLSSGTLNNLTTTGGSAVTVSITPSSGLAKTFIKNMVIITPNNTTYQWDLTDVTYSQGLWLFPSNGFLFQAGLTYKVYLMA